MDSPYQYQKGWCLILDPETYQGEHVHAFSHVLYFDKWQTGIYLFKGYKISHW